jgi:hypothetical protein
MAEPSWQELVDVARWAPSPHNMQPWKVRVTSAAEAELMADPGRLLPETDSDGAFMTVGLGIFVETLAVAAHACGHEVDVELVGEVDPRAARPVTFARLRLVEGRVADALSPRLVLERRTSRVPYDGRPVDPRVVDELGDLAASYGHRLESSSDPALVDWVLELNRDTLFFDLTDEVARREVGAWLRFSAAEAAQRADGFSPAALGFPGPLLRAYFGAAGAFELPGLRHAIRTLYGRTMRGTRTVGWLAGPWGGRDEWFTSGRMLARLWLTMTRRGVVLHPFGSVITNAVSNAQLQERIAVSDGTLWLLFRAGYSSEPPRSHRLAPAEVLVA